MRLESPHDLDIDDAVTLEIREEPLHRFGIRDDFTLRCDSHPSARPLIEVQQPNHALSAYIAAPTPPRPRTSHADGAAPTDLVRP